jgi:alkaline phosphatase
MDRMPYGSWARTGSLPPGTVTDSAAAATALATGVKTNNRVIGQDPDGNPLTTILERAQARGWAVGLVTNVQMAHATPAAFAAHVPDRYMMTEIASQTLAADVNVLLGGGEDEFLPVTTSGHYPQPGERTDGRNLIDEAVAAGYTYVYDAPGLAAVVPSSTTHLLGLFADEVMGRPLTPSLAEMTQQAIDVLSQDPDGFFLMVEGGQIDLAGHANDAANVISDTIGFDEAIAVAQTYASTIGDVLIIVTGDHETGGMSVALTHNGAPGEDGPFLMPGGAPFFVNWTTIGHTAADVPTTAQGPWSDLLVGTVENTYLHDVKRLALESSPELSLTQVTIPPQGSPVRPGDHITYTLVLTNNGVADATGLSLTDTLPAGTSFIPGSAGATLGLGVAAMPPPALVFTGRLPTGQALTATFAVAVTLVPSGTLLVNEAEVTATRSGVVADTATHPVVAFSNRVILLPIMKR